MELFAAAGGDTRGRAFEPDRSHGGETRLE
jgi:hypothetical protein